MRDPPTAGFAAFASLVFSHLFHPEAHDNSEHTHFEAIPWS